MLDNCRPWHKGIYILDSLRKSLLWRRWRDRLVAYCLVPTYMWTAFGGAPPSVATFPFVSGTAVLSMSVKADAALLHSATFDLSISTPRPAKSGSKRAGLPSKFTMIVPAFGYATCVHFAKSNIPIIWPARSIDSCPGLIEKSYGVPAKSVNILTPWATRFWRRTRGALSFSSSTWRERLSFCSCAVAVVNAATFSSEICCNWTAAIVARLPNTYSPPTPPATKMLANIKSHFSVRDISFAKISKTANSTISPITTASVANSARELATSNAFFRTATGEPSIGYVYYAIEQQRRLLVGACALLASLVLLLVRLFHK